MLVYTAILKIPLFFYPYPESVKGGYLSERIINNLDRQSTEIIISILIIFLAAVYLNKIVIENRITRESTLFPGLFFILMTSIIPELGMLSPPLLGILPFLISLEYLLLLYKNSEYSGKVFNMGFWLSTASLFYFPYIYFSIFILIGISILKYVRIADIFRLLIGLLTPYILTFYYFFWIGDTGNMFDSLIGNYFGIINFPVPFNIQFAIKLALISILLIIVVLNYGQYIKKKNVQAINKIDVLYWGAGMAGITVFIVTPLTIYHLIVLLPFLGAMMAMMFINISNKIVAEFLHVVLLGFGFYIHYITFV